MSNVLQSIKFQTLCTKTDYSSSLSVSLHRLWFHLTVCVSVLILDARQKRAEELRRLTDKSASMSEEQLTELRAEIKVNLEHCHTRSDTGYDVWRHKVIDFAPWWWPIQLLCIPPTLLFPLQHFVSERKYDEDLGKALRFTFDLEPLKTSISGFGSGTPPLAGTKYRQKQLSCSKFWNL